MESSSDVGKDLTKLGKGAQGEESAGGRKTTVKQHKRNIARPKHKDDIDHKKEVKKALERLLKGGHMSTQDVDEIYEIWTDVKTKHG